MPDTNIYFHSLYNVPTTIRQEEGRITLLSYCFVKDGCKPSILTEFVHRVSISAST